jgi:hypothetical protein
MAAKYLAGDNQARCPLTRISIAIAALTIALAGVEACAQYPGGGQSGGRGIPGGAGSTPGIRSSQDRRGERPPDTPVSLIGEVEMQLDRLEEDLRITAAQQAAWDAYARKVIRLADDVARARFAARATQEAPATALQQFDRLADVARNRLTAVDEIANAGRALYAVLTPEQKALADRRLAPAALALANGLPPPAPSRSDDKPPPGAPPRSP